MHTERLKQVLIANQFKLKQKDDIIFVNTPNKNFNYKGDKKTPIYIKNDALIIKTSSEPLSDGYIQDIRTVEKFAQRCGVEVVKPNDKEHRYF